jgi:hypothetical protein
MTLKRDTLGIPGAVQKVVGLIGADKAALLVNKSSRIVYYWAEEGDPRTPSVIEAATLDAAYIQAGGTYPPIQTALAAMIDAMTTAPSRGALADELAEVSKECGEAVAAGIKVLGGDVSEPDIRRALVEVHEGVAHMGGLARRLMAMLEESAA